MRNGKMNKNTIVGQPFIHYQYKSRRVNEQEYHKGVYPFIHYVPIFILGNDIGKSCRKRTLDPFFCFVFCRINKKKYYKS